MARVVSIGETYTINDRMNQLVLAHLDARAWRATLPGQRGRTIAAIFAHVHNIRCKWIRLTAPHVGVPVRLDRTRCTPRQAGIALARSAARCVAMLTDPELTTFHRDGWAKRWPVGPSMLAYMITHDAHHRGQVCMLAHQLGYPLPNEVGYGIWAWERLAGPV
ncbi:MAG TPA: DinB family protein [Gemmatimonadaceae bacterium]|jgi:uncharacterized damage-inducible protein DinB|nr:DinB family protein [Gemmatimonadaceae bacterium]